MLDEHGFGCIPFSPLAQGLLTDRDLDGVHPDSRASQGMSLPERFLHEQNLRHIRALHFSDEELTQIEPHAVDGGIDLWEEPRTA